jgi:hypothetical protein
MNTRELIETGLTPAQQALSDLWDEHDEFAAKDARAALDTMPPDAYVNHVPDGDFERKFCGVLVALICVIASIVIVFALK